MLNYPNRLKKLLPAFLCSLFINTLLINSPAFAATPVLTNALPSEHFAGEQVCFDLSFANTDAPDPAPAPGFGPYTRLILPPEMSLDSATYLGSGITIETIGTFAAAPGNTLEDPRTETNITGPQGSTFYLLVLPLGSVVEGGPDIVTEICSTINTSAVIGTALDVITQPVYEFGNTATGTNGPREGTSTTTQITPTLYTLTKNDNAPEGERPPGPDFPIIYTLTVDVANGKTAHNLVINDTLPADLQYLSPVNITGGVNCQVITEPNSAPTPGGGLQVTCDEVTGTTADNDLVIDYTGYIIDTLDETVCTTENQTNTATLDGEHPPNTAQTQLTDDRTVIAKHIALQKTAAPATLDPGNSVTFTLNFQVSDYATANALVLTDTLPDGMTFDSHQSANLSGTPLTITPAATANGDGTTTVVYNVQGAAGNLAPGTTGQITYTATIDQLYNNGQPVLSSDSLTNNITAGYGLTAGANSCNDTSRATVVIEPNSLIKEVINPQAQYTPGDTVTFRLTMTIPSGDTNDIVFEDFFPLPVFDVSTLNLTFGNDITHAPTDTVGVAPSNISIDAALNKLTIEWPDVASAGTETIAVDIDIVLENTPYSDGLFLTNLFQATTRNSAPEIATLQAPVQITTRSPELVITKGISATNNSNSTITPTPATPVDSDLSDADAGDTVTFVVTVENQGGALADNVTITDNPPSGLTGCTITSVTDGNSSPLTYTGNLSSGLVLNSTLAANDGTEGAPYATDTALITYTCNLATSVTPAQEITNEAQASWTAAGSSTSFDPVTDDATITIAPAHIDKAVASISPGPVAPAVTVEDTITYTITVVLPEGTTPALTIRDILPAGFEYQSYTLNTTGFSGTITTPSPTANVTGTVNTGQTIALNFGDTTVAVDNDNSNNSFTISLVATVTDDSANNALSSTQQKRNNVSLLYTGIPAAVSDVADVNFAEPNLQITKAMTSNVDAGDTVTVTLTLANAGTAPAYDMTIKDTLNDAGVLFDLSTVTVGTTPAGYTYNYTNPTVTYTSNAGTVLAAGASVTFTFTATVANTVVPGSSYENSVDVTGDGQNGTVTDERENSDNDTTNTSITTASISKTMSGSSESFTAGSDIAIGEVLTFRLSVNVPEGILPADTSTPLATVTDTLPAGLEYQSGTAQIRAVNVNNSLNGSTYGSLPATATSITPDVSGQTLSFDLGTLTNSDNDIDVEQIIITYDVLVLNDSANNRSDSKTNTGSLNYLNSAGTAQSQTDTYTATVVEPNLALTKTASPSSVQGGGTVTFTVTLTNQSGTDVTAAWDPVITDTLPARFQSPTVVSATHSNYGNIATCASISGQLITLDPTACLTTNSMAAGESMVLVYSATVDPTIDFDEDVTNTADGTASSLPGSNGTGNATPGTAGSNTGERTGSGTDENDLAASNSATVTSGQPTLTKTVADTQLQIGETTTFTLTSSVPGGENTNFVITDNLPTGLRYTGTVNITLPSGVTRTSNTNPAAGDDPLVFNFGTISNSTGTAQNVTIEYEVAAENIAANQDGVTLSNSASLSYDNSTGTLPTASQTLAIIEPNLETTKAITSGAAGSEAGDAITYEITVTNNSTAATAYNVALTDILPAGLLGGTAPFFDNIVVDNASGAIVRSSDGNPLSVADAQFSTTSTTDDTLGFTFNLPPSTTLTLTYEATVSSAALAGETLTNNLATVYTSDAAGNGRNSNDSQDDDDSNLNNYGETTSQNVVIASGIALQKSLNSKHTHNDFTIGDLVTFDLRVDLIEGTTNNLILTDELPSGITFEGPVRIIAGSHISYTGTGTAVESPTGTLTINMGNVTNQFDSDTNNDYFVVEVDARVDNIAANVAGTNDLENSASLTSSAGNAGPSTATIDIVEPNLTLTKVADDTAPSLGDIVTYTITVSHNSSTADAYDVVLTDVIPAGLSYVSSSHSGDGSVDETNPTRPVFDLGTITLVEGSKSFTYQAQVDTSATVGNDLTNNISLTYDGQSGTPDNQRSYSSTADATVTPNISATLEATKTVALVVDNTTSGQVDPGDTLEYTVVITNPGADVTGAVFTDPVPANTTYVAGSLNSSSGTTNDSNTRNLSVDIGNLANGASVTITFRVTVDAGTASGTIISNQGSVDSDQTVPEPTDLDGNDSNGDQPTTIPVGPLSSVEYDLYTQKSVSWVNDADNDGLITAGDTLEYSFIFYNEGSETLTNVTLADTLPAGLTYNGTASITGTGSNISVTGSSVSASIGQIAANTFETARVQVTIDSPLLDTDSDADNETFTNQGSVGSDQTTTNTTDGNSSRTDGNQPTTISATSAGGEPVLDLEKRWQLSQDVDGDGGADPGDTITYTLTLTNTGSATATNARLQDNIPANTTLVAGSVFTSQGAVITSNPVAVNLANLDPASIATIRFSVVIDSSTGNGTVISNQANVTADGGISTISDNNSTDADGLNPTLTPVHTHNGNTGNSSTPSIGKQLTASSQSSSTGNLALIGEILTYQVTLTVPAGETDNVVLSDTLPAGLAYVAGTGRLSRTFDTSLTSSTNIAGINSQSSGSFVALSDGSHLAVSGQTVSLSLGSLINSDNDSNDEQITLEYQAQVTNISTNQQGVMLSNSASAQYTDNLNQLQTLSPAISNVTVAEPALVIDKTSGFSSIYPAGGNVEYSITVTNQGTATAFDVEIIDDLPAVFSTMTVNSITTSGGVSGVTDTSAGTDLSVVIDLFPAGGSLTISLTAEAISNLTVGDDIENTASVGATSLPGAGTGTPGAANGERTSAGGVNDLSASSAIAIRVVNRPPRDIPTLPLWMLGLLFLLLGYSARQPLSKQP